MYVCVHLIRVQQTVRASQEPINQIQVKQNQFLCDEEIAYNVTLPINKIFLKLMKSLSFGFFLYKMSYTVSKNGSCCRMFDFPFLYVCVRNGSGSIQQGCCVGDWCSYFLRTTMRLRIPMSGHKLNACQHLYRQCVCVRYTNKTPLFLRMLRKYILCINTNRLLTHPRHHTSAFQFNNVHTLHIGSRTLFHPSNTIHMRKTFSFL